MKRLAIGLCLVLSGMAIGCAFDEGDPEETASAELDVTVTCGGMVYTKQLVNGCSGGICRTTNTPTECTSASSPCAYYVGTCSNGVFADRSYNANDLYFKTGTPGNPSSNQSYWSLYTGSTLGNSQPIYYRATPAQVAGPGVAAPGPWAGDVETENCSGGLALQYLKMSAAAITPGAGRWWAILPARVNGSQPSQVFTGACSGGKRAFRDFNTRDYYDGSHGWYGDQPAWVLDLGPTTGSPVAAYVRQTPPVPGGGGGGECRQWAGTCGPSSVPAGAVCCPDAGTCMVAHPGTPTQTSQCCFGIDQNGFCLNSGGLRVDDANWAM